MRIAAELHCHTYHSDARFSPEELAESARDMHLDLIAMTDHNTRSAYTALAKTGIPFIHGIEWTTFFGHMLVLGQEHMVDWRDARIENIDAKIAEVHEAGGICGVAHPYVAGNPFCTGCYWDFDIKDWTKVDYLEIWNGENLPSLVYYNLRAKRLWISLLDKGLHLPPTYGRDWHAQNIDALPVACTYLEAEEISEAAALKAIRTGKTLLSLGPDAVWTLEKDGQCFSAGDTLCPGTYTLTVSVDTDRRRKVWEPYDIRVDRVSLNGAGNRILATLPGNGGSCSVTLGAEDLYCRLEGTGSACGKACDVFLSAPAYIG